MEAQILLLSLFVACTLPLLVLSYLRKVLFTLLSNACGSPEAADFWFRCVQILAVSGSLVLVIGTGSNATAWLPVIRSTLIWSSIGIFIAVALVANAVWSSIVKPTLAQTNNRKTNP